MDKLGEIAEKNKDILDKAAKGTAAAAAAGVTTQTASAATGLSAFVQETAQKIGTIGIAGTMSIGSGAYFQAKTTKEKGTEIAVVAEQEHKVFSNLNDFTETTIGFQPFGGVTEAIVEYAEKGYGDVVGTSEEGYEGDEEGEGEGSSGEEGEGETSNEEASNEGEGNEGEPTEESNEEGEEKAVKEEDSVEESKEESEEETKEEEPEQEKPEEEEKEEEEEVEEESEEGEPEEKEEPEEQSEEGEEEKTDIENSEETFELEEDDQVTQVPDVIKLPNMIRK
jgi:flagellar biosynthesis GTPase FlhF